MPYTFRIVFGGLCALVPGDDRLDVLLVNTENEQVKKLKHQPDRHFATLEYSLADLPGGGTTDRRGTWPLRFDDVTVTTTSQKTPLELRQRVHKLDEVPTGVSGLRKPDADAGQDDLAWIPRLGAVCPAIGAIDSDCLADHPSMHRTEGLIKARFRIDQGVVRSFEASSFNGQDILVEFVPKVEGSKAGRAAIPHLAAVEMQVDDGESVTFSIARFDGSSRDELKFAPPAADGATVSVFLTNLCCGGYSDRPINELPEEDVDYECFYVLLENFDELAQKFDRLPIPVPVDFQAEPSLHPEVGGGGSVKCSMTRLDR